MLKLSIIVPIYNVRAYLRKCVESLWAQDIAGSEYEVILVDDGSTDGSGELCDTLITEAQQNSDAPYMQVLHHENGGVAVARNHGVNVAKGKYVAFLDADDWWTDNHASEMLKLEELYPDAGLYASTYWYVKRGRNEMRIRDIVWLENDSEMKGDYRRGYINYFRSYYLGDAMPIWTGTVMIPKEIFLAEGGFPVGIKLGEDFLLWARIALTHKVAYSTKSTAYYNNDTQANIRATKKQYHTSEYMYTRFDDILRAAEDKTLIVSIDDVRALLNKLAKEGEEKMKERTWYEEITWKVRVMGSRMKDVLYRLIS